MILSFHPCFVADAQIILGDRRLGAHDLSLIDRAEAILLPQGCSRDLFEVCKSSSALLFPNWEKRFEYPGKVGQSLLFEEMGWPHPGTRRWASVAALRDALCAEGSHPHEVPFLLKRNNTHEGAGVYLIGNAADLESALVEMERCGDSAFISQDRVPAEGNVLRAVLMGSRTTTYWKRPARPDEIITTISRGACVDTEWRYDLQEKGKAQARQISEHSGINLAALDFVFPLADPDPQPLILEINYYFGRRGLGGSLAYYRLLFHAIREWLSENGLDPNSLDLV